MLSRFLIFLFFTHACLFAGDNPEVHVADSSLSNKNWVLDDLSGPLQNSTYEDVIDVYTSHLEKLFDELEEDGRFKDLRDLQIRDQILSMLVQVRMRELEHSDYYQVLHSQDSQYYTFQVIAKELYQQLHSKLLTDFEFLRYPGSHLFNSTTAFFDAFPEMKKPGPNQKVFDILPEVSRQILAASFSMEYYTGADSALFVFLFGKGVGEWYNTRNDEAYKEKFRNNLRELFESAGLSQYAYEPYLEYLVMNAPKTKQGIINQIFLPKEKIENYLYISLPLGFFDVDKNRNIAEIFANFENERMKYGDHFDHKIKCQARVISGSLFNKNVKILRHTLIPEDAQRTYEKLVKDTITSILEDTKK